MSDLINRRWKSSVFFMEIVFVKNKTFFKKYHMTSDHGSIDHGIIFTWIIAIEILKKK